MEIKEITEELQGILDMSLDGLVLKEDCIISYDDDYKGKEVQPGEPGKARVTVELDMKHYTVRQAFGKAVSPLKIRGQNSKRAAVRDRTSPEGFTSELHGSTIHLEPGAPRESIKDPLTTASKAVDEMSDEEFEIFRKQMEARVSK